MLISTRTQLINNLDRIENYLTSSSDEIYDAMAQYIAHGRVFVSYIVDGKLHFAPSRFVGYKNNTLIKHQNNEEKNGTITTPIISKILKSRNKFYAELEEAYITYCEWLCVTPTKHKRTYWRLSDDIINEMISEPFQEGGWKTRTHLVRERNYKVVQEAKNLFKSTHDGRLFCEVCGFDFTEKYGKVGEGFIEAHHKIELSKTDGEHEIKPTDFAMVCSNCHSMLHRGDLTIAKLKNRLIK